MENILFFDILGSIIGLGLVFGLMFGGYKQYISYKVRFSKGLCTKTYDKIVAKGGLYGGFIIGLCLFIFILIEWLK